MEMPVGRWGSIYSNSHSSRMLLNALCCMLLLSVSWCETERGLGGGAVCSEADRAALLSFKGTITEDTTHIMSSWTGTDCCGEGWEGVWCNPAGRVTILQLERFFVGGDDSKHYMKMKGTLSPSLGNLHFLEVMVIRGLKQITGPIPDSFFNLTRLTNLALEYNSLDGNIPSGL